MTQNLARRHGWPVGVVKELNAALAVRARKADPELFRAALVKLQRNATSYAQELVGLFDAILGSQN